MENLPLVSVIVCSYNAEQYIDESISSIINQSYENLEIIVINDGSTD
ncbi:TPA: glycosyltransferase family 2 protein, partial [Haemophilus influenzae]